MTFASSSTISLMHCRLLFLYEFPTVRHRYNTNPYRSEDVFCTCVAFSRSCEGVAYMILNTQYKSNHIHIPCLLTFRLLRLYCTLKPLETLVELRFFKPYEVCIIDNGHIWLDAPNPFGVPFPALSDLFSVVEAQELIDNTCLILALRTSTEKGAS